MKIINIMVELPKKEISIMDQIDALLADVEEQSSGPSTEPSPEPPVESNEPSPKNPPKPPKRKRGPKPGVKRGSYRYKWDSDENTKNKNELNEIGDKLALATGTKFQPRKHKVFLVEGHPQRKEIELDIVNGMSDYGIAQKYNIHYTCVGTYRESDLFKNILAHFYPTIIADRAINFTEHYKNLLQMFFNAIEINDRTIKKAEEDGDMITLAEFQKIEVQLMKLYNDIIKTPSTTALNESKTDFIKSFKSFAPKPQTIPSQVITPQLSHDDSIDADITPIDGTE